MNCEFKSWKNNTEGFYYYRCIALGMTNYSYLIMNIYMYILRSHLFVNNLFNVTLFLHSTGLFRNFL